jgi:hypothetical protein
MIDYKQVKKKIVERYIGVFLGSNINYIKKDVRTYVNHDDWKDVRYVSDVIELDKCNLVFHIKKSHIRLFLRVDIFDKNMKNLDTIDLYNDWFYLKRDSILKNKMLEIANVVDYEGMFHAVKGDTVFMRKLKLDELKNKI